MMTENHSTASTPPTQAAAPGRRLLPWAWRVVSVRLRFLLVLGAAFAVVAGWDVVRNYWDKLVRGATAADPGSQAVSGDTEYFCPMDPGVVGDWPAKCPICNMALVRRKRGDATPLPEGVIARMQLSPYRLQLAGIRTTPVGFLPLAREAEGPGRVLSAADGEKSAVVELSLFAGECAGLAEGQEGEVVGDGSGPLRAVVRGVEDRPEAGEADVRLEVSDPSQLLRPGASIRGRVRIPITTVEPFRSLPAGPPALRPGERRRVYACDEHPDVVREQPGRCPKDDRALGRRDLAEDQRLRWWCPMHPEVTAESAGRRCDECGGMELVPRVVTFGPGGQVLAVPESAVIDTGTRTVVYVERMPGMFDGVEVVLGPRCGESYPVIRGLEPGQHVATSGAFLVDAETRLNPSVAASYFGAGNREGSEASQAAPAPEEDGLAPADRALVAGQKICPVTGKPLGSMGTPTRLEVKGRVVYLCCEGCEPKLREAPDRYLAKLPPATPGRAPDAKRAP
jgi:YHS domain-containing protein